MTNDKIDAQTVINRAYESLEEAGELIDQIQDLRIFQAMNSLHNCLCLFCLCLLLDHYQQEGQTNEK